ncbi:hypothetical protein [Massilia sp. YMA4]|uniref:hypothetical protein n=1 Tax=Massilia sp. YMA4 TaxID=1593482 RepID=UPI001877E98B|nr:hypothetical protein [Massilia sp. YMA4]
MGIAEKIIANKQKRNLIALQDQLIAADLDKSVLSQLLYPQSSQILQKALENINKKAWEKKFFVWPSPDCENEIISHLSDLRSRKKTVLCFFPNYSPGVDGVTSDLPVLEISADKIIEWYKIAKSQGLHFFLCASRDFREGIALDVYEADPIAHQTAGAVCDLYFWNE